jgi:ribosomal protein S18 acetylase RimI-like enzyme
MTMEGEDADDGLSVREAAEGDLDDLAELLVEGFAFHAQYLPEWFQVPEGYDTAGQKPYLRDALDAQDSVILMAVAAGKTVGFAVVSIKETVGLSLVVEKKYAYVQSLIVTESSRRGGVGSLLMRAVEDWARGQEATQVQLDMWEFDGGPLGFYEKLGYKTMRRRMAREV